MEISCHGSYIRFRVVTMGMLLSGSGLGLMYQPSLVMVGHYFEKKRALATGIAICGSGIGAFIFGPLSELLLDTYGWKGALWIIAGICLNGVVVSALLRPVNTFDSNKPKALELPSINQDCKLIVSHDNRKEQTKLEEKECCDWNSVFYFPLLKSPTFLLYGVACFLFMLGM